MIVTKPPLTVLDIETSIGMEAVKDLNPALMPAVFARSPWVAVTRQRNELRRWTNFESEQLLSVLREGCVVGWNIKSFDLPIISMTSLLNNKPGWDAPIATADLFAEINRAAKQYFKTEVFYSLQSVAELNLDDAKLGSSAEIPALFGTDLERVYAHCERDVQLEWALYQRAREHGLELPPKPATKYSPPIPAWVFKLDAMPF